MTLPPASLRAKALGVLAACCISYVIGRGTQKTITVEKVREVEQVAAQKVEAAKAEVAVAKQAADSDTTRWRTRTVYLPGGTVEVVKEVVREVDKGVVETRTETVTKTVTVEKVVFRDRLQVVAPPPRPSWAVGAAAGVDLGGRLRYGGDVARRVGPLWFTAGVDVPTRAATLGLRLEF